MQRHLGAWREYTTDPTVLRTSLLLAYAMQRWPAREPKWGLRGDAYASKWQPHANNSICMCLRFQPTQHLKEFRNSLLSSVHRLTPKKIYYSATRLNNRMFDLRQLMLLQAIGRFTPTQSTWKKTYKILASG